MKKRWWRFVTRFTGDPDRVDLEWITDTHTQYDPQLVIDHYNTFKDLMAPAVTLIAAIPISQPSTNSRRSIEPRSWEPKP